MRKDITNLKQEYESIEVPAELDLVIEKALRKGKRAKTTGRVYKLTAAVAALVLVFVLSVNVSPAFAHYIGVLPGMESLIKLVSFDKGLVDIVDHGFGQVINQSATDNDLTLTVENAIFDGRKLILGVKIQSEKQLEMIGSIRYYLTDANGNKQEISSYNGCHTGENTKVFRTLFEFEIGQEGNSFPEKLVFGCTSIEQIYETAQGSQREIITGNWSIPFTLDTELAMYEPKQVTVNQEVTVGDVKFTVDSMKIYPTVVDVNITIDKDNPVNITHFKNAKLLDDNNVYKFRMGGAEADNSWMLSFESSYFIDSDHLTLAIDGVYTMPREETYFVLDIENELVLEDGGLGIEFLRKGISFNSYNKQQELTVWFKLNDPEFEQEDMKFVWVDWRVHDLSGEPFDIITATQCPDCPGGDEFGLSFKADEETPQVIRAKVIGVSKGIMESVQIKLQ